ncbi:MAG: ATP-binding protein [Proteobacteria bacterium]|nr:ATP-binding protein [Pseudomonadota bacterium]
MQTSLEESTESTADIEEEFSPQWGETAPKGGRAVLNRVLRDGNKVPLFLGQTLINSLRDVGYNSTTSAVCEHVDNAIQAGATEIRVYFHQTGQRSTYELDILVYDNGKGMAPHVLQVATSFGGSMYYENRMGIGRFGVGMKTAALSMGPVFELYSWQEPTAIYTMTLDVDEISSNRSNLIELPEPRLLDTLPSQVARVLTKPLVYPRDQAQQDLLAGDEDELLDQMGRSGTIVFIPECDRLTYKKAQTLAEHATKEMARIYRFHLGNGLRLFINNRRIEPFDPTYWMQNARHASIPDLPETRSRLVNSWPEIQIPVQEGSSRTAPASVRVYMLPIEAWYGLPRKVLKNDLQVFEDHLVSFVRNDREVHIGAMPELSGRRHADSVWLRIQVDFDGRLDEAFGIAMNKQGVRPKKYALGVIREEIREEVARVREKTAQYRAEHTRKASKSNLSDAERRANEADAFQGKPLPQPAPQTEEERQALEENFRTLAITLKRHDETDEEAFQRIKSSRYITVFKHDEYWPFYHVDFTLGKVILTINTAHPFFSKLYEPLGRLSISNVEEDEEMDEKSTVKGATTEGGELLVALQMLLFSLARAQSQMLAGADASEHEPIFEILRREWSASLKTQLETA